MRLTFIEWLNNPKYTRFECLLCGRNKFIRKTPHYCIGGFRKRKIKWKQIN